LGQSNHSKKAIIIGGGPAGLTAAYEFLKHTDVLPFVIEAENQLGGISKTVNYKGNLMDIGGHRFVSKSDRVMNWWLDHLPIENGNLDHSLTLSYQGKSVLIDSPNLSEEHNVVPTDNVMLVRNRISRIYFLRKFFTYPISPSFETIRNLGLLRVFRIFMSYLFVKISPKKKERSLEDFFINRFGKELYKTFFKDYTEKVWGVSCTEISAEWGAQRIKGLSISTALLHASRNILKLKNRSTDIAQKKTETSLIENFLYPKFGPGQMWEVVGNKILKQGGKIFTECSVNKIHIENNLVQFLEYTDKGGNVHRIEGEHFISSMPVKDLINIIEPPVPIEIKNIANGLVYRDFIAVGVLIDKFKGNKKLDDNWIYIQEKDVKVGRMQIFNNWSPFLVSDSQKYWLGLEYFCQEGDDLWSLSDDEILKVAISELIKLDFIDECNFMDGTVLKVPKTYPAYFGSYKDFGKIVEYLGNFENLFLVGRNGMHKYNNQDHSMLTSMQVVQNIKDGIVDKSNIWSINTEMDYHEEK